MHMRAHFGMCGCAEHHMPPPLCVFSLVDLGIDLLCFTTTCTQDCCDTALAKLSASLLNYIPLGPHTCTTRNIPVRA